jgi:hypothetical protein
MLRANPHLASHMAHVEIARAGEGNPLHDASCLSFDDITTGPRDRHFHPADRLRARPHPGAIALAGVVFLRCDVGRLLRKQVFPFIVISWPETATALSERRRQLGKCGERIGKPTSDMRPVPLANQ